MRDYYAEFLQIKNSVNTLPNEVSKVSKGRIFDAKQTFDTFDTTLHSINHKFYVPPNNNELADFKSEKLHEVLNQFIEKGITFDVSADDFQFIDPWQNLKASDKEFLKLNDAVILCQLQQSLLMKHLFSHSPEQFEDFAFEIVKRESLLTITAKTPFEIYRTVVEDVTRTWFEKLINEETT